MATDPLAYFEERLRDRFEGAELWDEDDRLNAVSADEETDFILDSMLMYDQDVADYFAAIPLWFEFDNIFSGTVKARDIASWAVAEYCKSESEYLEELIENGF